MKIAVVGCGAVGSYYGGRFAGAGHDVHFLLRSDFDAVRNNGLHVISPQGNFHVRPQCARKAEDIGQADLVLVALKTTANHRFAELLPPLVGPGTAVLTFQNGLGNEEELARLFPPRQVLGGLCFVCLNRLEPGLVQHIDYGQVVLGEFQRPSDQRTRQLAQMFQQAGVPCALTEDLPRAHWEKLTWNIPFNGLGVASAAGYEALTREEVQDSLGSTAVVGRVRPGEPQRNLAARGRADCPQPAATTCPPVVGRVRPGEPQRSLAARGRADCPQPAATSLRRNSAQQPATPLDLQPCLTTDKLLSDPRWASLVRELMLEVIHAARAKGFPLEDSLADDQIARTRTMGAYKASTLIDFERGQPLELHSLFLEPLRQAHAAGANVPRLEALCEVLRRLAQAANAA